MSVTGCVIMLCAGQGARAQQAQPTSPPEQENAPLQEIVVSGIRKAVEEAIALKKDSDLIVEAVSAEDIGKLPDLSIADSIARLPGVAAQRDQYGNATQLSIRGMGPDFVGTTLNGRSQTSTQDTRSVDYASYPAELINAVVVYKTPDASLIGQGLAGTVDIRTVKPLDSDGLTVAANARKEWLGKGLPESGYGDRFSLSVIDQFFDHTLGVAAGIARLDDHGGTTDDSGTWGSGSMQYDGATVNVPYAGLNEESDQAHQSRTGLMAVVQWKPNDHVESEVDAFYSKFFTEDRLWELQMGLSGPQGPNGMGASDYLNPATGLYDWVWRQPPTTLVDADIVDGTAVSGTIDGVRPVIQNIAIGSDQRLRSIGWNTKFEVTDDLKLTADLSANDAYNQNYDIETYAGTPTVYNPALGSTTPITSAPPGQLVPGLTNITFNANNLAIGSSLNFANPQNTVFTDVLGWSCCGQEQPGYIKYPLTRDRLYEVNLGGTLDLHDAWFKDFRFGVDLTDRHKENSTDEGYLWVKGTNGALYQNGAHIPGDTLELAGESGLEIPTYDVYSLWNQYFQIGQRATPDILSKDWTVNEQLVTAFGQYDIKSQLGPIPLGGNIGVQVVNADQTSTAYAATGVNGQDALLPGYEPILVNLGATSTYVLPSLNLVGDLGDGQKLRLSIARQMARPNMIDMNASTSVTVIPNPNPGQSGNLLSGSGGDPYLKPFLAKALDLSYEKYFENRAYLSVAGFYKHLDSYILQIQNNSFDFTGLVSPGLQVPTEVGEYTTDVNGSGGKIYGSEFAFSLPFDILTRYLDGFGMAANYTITNSDITEPNIIGNSGNGTTVISSGGTMPLPGLSQHTGALELYYERAGFEARVAERYRTEFIGTLISNFGVPGYEYVRTEAPLDAQLSYLIQQGWLKGLQVQLQGQNLKNTPFRTSNTITGATTNQYFGKTYLAGLNYKF